MGQWGNGAMGQWGNGQWAMGNGQWNSANATNEGSAILEPRSGRFPCRCEHRSQFTRLSEYDRQVLRCLACVRRRQSFQPMNGLVDFLVDHLEFGGEFPC